MNHLVEALKNTIEQLKTHPYVIVDEVNINEPATAELIDTFEMITNIRVPQNVKDFYRSANGLTCVWRIRQDLPEDVRNEIRLEGEQGDYDYSKPLGAIKILPVQDMLMDNYWKPPFQNDSNSNQKFEFNNQEFTLGTFAKKLKIFDAYDVPDDYRCIAFVIGLVKAEKQFYLLMLDDYFADWHNSRLVDFETYIRALCDTRFTIPGRKRLFGKYRGDKEPVLTYADLNPQELVPALFR